MWEIRVTAGCSCWSQMKCSLQDLKLKSLRLSSLDLDKVTLWEALQAAGAFSCWTPIHCLPSLWLVLWLTHHPEFSFGLRRDKAWCCVPFFFFFIHFCNPTLSTNFCQDLGTSSIFASVVRDEFWHSSGKLLKTEHSLSDHSVKCCSLILKMEITFFGGAIETKHFPLELFFSWCTENEILASVCIPYLKCKSCGDSLHQPERSELFYELKVKRLSTDFPKGFKTWLSLGHTGTVAFLSWSRCSVTVGGLWFDMELGLSEVNYLLVLFFNLLFVGSTPWLFSIHRLSSFKSNQEKKRWLLLASYHSMKWD